MDNCEPLTSGGDSTLTNGNEQECLNHCVMVPVRIEGTQEGELH